MTRIVRVSPGLSAGAAHTNPEQGSNRNDTTLPRRTTNNPPELGERHPFHCDGCGSRKANATYKMTRFGYPDWLIGSRSSSCPRGGECLRLIAEQCGTTPEKLKYDPRPYLAAIGPRREGVSEGGFGRSATSAAKWADDLPIHATFAGRCVRLMAEVEPLSYLIKTRQIDPALVEKHLIGWGENPYGQPALTFPMFDATGALVTAKWRFPRDGLQMRSWPGSGRRWPLYPPLKADWPWVLLVAGELDALRALSARLPAVSVTCGADAWRDGWTEELVGRLVIVCFDNNEQVPARARVRTLRTAGVEARMLDLRRLGVTGRKGDLSDYLNAGGSSRHVRRAASGSPE